MEVKTRVAPSPTGIAHVGTAYAALFNWAYARKNKGEFVLRIEDTDKKRNVEGGEEAIESGLRWLGLDWDGPSARQSDRLSVYKKHAGTLLEQGKAYREKGGVILKVEPKEVQWEDEIRGRVSFPSDQVKDFAIVKGDGFPAYNFAVVVDDHEMNISHVIRAEDHISNTPRQIKVYEAFGWEMPEFAHFPLLRNPDKSKISKRKNPVAIEWYRQEGFLPETLVNFLSLLGWSHPEGKEIFDVEEFVEKFSLSRVQKAGPVFDLAKLRWMNGVYIRTLTAGEFADRIMRYDLRFKNKNLIKKIVPLVQTRVKTLKEFGEIAGFFFEEPEVDPARLGENYKRHLSAAAEAIEKGEDLEKTVERHGFHTSHFFMDLRIAVTGRKVTPPINESMEILGKDKALGRINKWLKT